MGRKLADGEFMAAVRDLWEAMIDLLLSGSTWIFLSRAFIVRNSAVFSLP
jgi:hypothetical protein